LKLHLAHVAGEKMEAAYQGDVFDKPPQTNGSVAA
jgi:hypothetical protein